MTEKIFNKFQRGSFVREFAICLFLSLSLSLSSSLPLFLSHTIMRLRENVKPPSGDVTRCPRERLSWSVSMSAIFSCFQLKRSTLSDEKVSADFVVNHMGFLRVANEWKGVWERVRLCVWKGEREREREKEWDSKWARERERVIIQHDGKTEPHHKEIMRQSVRCFNSSTLNRWKNETLQKNSSSIGSLISLPQSLVNYHLCSKMYQFFAQTTNAVFFCKKSIIPLWAIPRRVPTYLHTYLCVSVPS